jgi:hypothetical protein
MIRTKKTLI